ncbi:hypothetical protein IWQ60_001794 [Tieghemiomyces parasiticus]|uniref:Condensation domain-containing protein n=1 Tax=Tieghemiomyces parasiticus TaxID=78921 RepID=A0A9W8E284_9FUNG|nr:hypothetical protein IWQ60_001794 [Tieghemiomyces parasiticus]
MLRARFSRDPSTGIVSYSIGSTAAKHYRFEYHQVATVEDMNVVLIESFQRLDFWDGHLSEFQVFDLNGTQYFFHCTHHLSNDYLTSAIISEEVEYLLLDRPLPPVTAPFQVWAAHLFRLAQQIDPRSISLPTGIPLLTTSLPTDVTPDGQLSHGRVLQLTLSGQETHRLLFDVCERLQASQLELILASVLETYVSVFRLGVLGLDFFTHGRQPLGPDLIDVTRTVGHFAHNFPLSITAPSELNMSTALRAVKQQLPDMLREGPKRALVKYLHNFQDPDLREKFKIQPQIAFSYLARLTAAGDNNEGPLFIEKPNLIESLRRLHRINEQPYALSITAQHAGDNLHLDIRHHYNLLPRYVAKKFLTKWRDTLLGYLQ